MGLFDIFKKKKEVQIDLNADYSKLLQHGIVFDHEKRIIPWNRPIVEIKKAGDISEKMFADRAVYFWGERSILKGLKIPLTTIFWYNDPGSEDRCFKNIEFTVEGNEEVDKYSHIIIEHLYRRFKTPVRKDNANTSEYFEWIIGDVKMAVNIYEKYSIKKLKFEVVKL